MDWHLYTDESGEFDTPDDWTIVAGTMVPSSTLISPSRGIRYLAEAAPHCPWPHHATHFRSPVLQAIWLAQADAGRKPSRRVVWQPRVTAP